MDNESIKKNIERKRSEKGLSQQEMADQLGIKRNTYRQIEKGSSSLISGHLQTIAKILDTTAEELVLGYKPSDGTKIIEDNEEYTKTLIHGYDKQIAELKVSISNLSREVADLRVMVEDKDLIIKYLKKELSEKRLV